MAECCSPLAGVVLVNFALLKHRVASLGYPVHDPPLTVLLAFLLLPCLKYQGAASSLDKQAEVPILSQMGTCVTMTAAQGEQEVKPFLSVSLRGMEGKTRNTFPAPLLPCPMVDLLSVWNHGDHVFGSSATP